MFDCGITMNIKKISDDMVTYIDDVSTNCIVSAVNEVGISIDKKKLLECINESKSYFDRGYKKGFDEGYDKAFTEIISTLRTNYIAYFGEDYLKGE